MTITREGTIALLSDKFWRGYASYVVTHCPYSKANQRFTLDETAEELLALAVNFDHHGTF